jgi:hypothetical protein
LAPGETRGHEWQIRRAYAYRLKFQRQGKDMAASDFAQSHRKVVAGTNRSFGFAFAAVFAVVGVWPYFSGAPLRLWALALGLIFLTAAVAFPRALAPLNWLWFKFGRVLHHVMNPLIMGVIYVGAVIPTGLLLKAFGKDVLRLKRDPDASSYWIERKPPGPGPKSMSRQF